ncbi:diguanylate cyclase [Xylophilus sp. Leaf220]|uniref:diguanylate cyclase n=1 Tax=Xylophilus sp. Leaf220 TaxID=1735686 RepID=UPI00070067CB|nr:diguanylate cyclase [Xylophilus sp. Leaf220]KQM80052.1 diguanylate cyclase [Xylophilus sp. Leaf220]
MSDPLLLLPCAVMVIAEGRVVRVNPACVALLEARDEGQLLGRSALDFVHPLDQTRSQHRTSGLQATDLPNTPTKMRARTCLGNLRMLLICSSAIVHEGTPAVLVSAMDMTGLSDMEAQLRESERSFRELFENMQDVYYRTDAQGVVVNVGPAVRRVLGQEPEDIIGRKAEAWYPAEADRDALKQAILARGEVSDFPGQMVRKDGRVIDISISSRALRDAQGNFAGVEGLWRDVTQRKNLERELQRMAHTDTLTGSANRRAFLQHAEACLARYRQDGTWFALLMIDIDHFKAVNDRFGHQEGDRVLVDFVQKLNSHIAGTDMLGRLGGEEFGVVLYRADEQEALRAGRHLLRQVAELPLPHDEGCGMQWLTASIGMAGVTGTDMRLSDLLERADRALYQAKHQGRNRIILG